MLKNIQLVSILLTSLFVLSACGEKKKSNDIITQRTVTAVPAAPVQMQAYTDERDVDWIGRSYHVTIHREPADSMAMVEDETGRKFVDNVFTLSVTRTDGSTFFSRKFTKQSFTAYLDADYRATGVFEGLVFDRAEGDWLVFGASVGHPQTDEYIPLVIRLSRMGELQTSVDTQMDTNSIVGDEGQEADDDAI